MLRQLFEQDVGYASCLEAASKGFMPHDTHQSLLSSYARSPSRFQLTGTQKLYFQPFPTLAREVRRMRMNNGSRVVTITSSTAEARRNATYQRSYVSVVRGDFVYYAAVERLLQLEFAGRFWYVALLTVFQPTDDDSITQLPTIDVRRIMDNSVERLYFVRELQATFVAASPPATAATMSRASRSAHIRVLIDKSGMPERDPALGVPND